MKRDLAALTDTVYDLLVIGGGIYGACVAWDAALRGLSVALVDKADFASATSANTLKIIHGGFRYLQSAGFTRMRQSASERRNLMRIAPHLVHPLPVIIPTYGGKWTRSRKALSLALKINNLVSFDRNRDLPPEKHIGTGGILSREETLRALPVVEERGLTGGLLFFDAQVYNSERLALAFLSSAWERGAALANYVRVTGFLRSGDTVTGVTATDALTGDALEIRARVTVNATGPWTDRVTDFLGESRPRNRTAFARAFNLVSRRQIVESYAAGIAGSGERFLFIAPWRGHSLLGTSYSAYSGHPDDFEASFTDAEALLQGFNDALPSSRLLEGDISFMHGGLLPLSAAPASSEDIRLAARHQIHDHRAEGVSGLISVLGVKYTTARHVAEKVVDRVFEAQGYKPPLSLSSATLLNGGKLFQVESLQDVQEIVPGKVVGHPLGITGRQMRQLIANYGSECPEALKLLDTPGNEADMEADDLDVLRAQARYAVRREMAQRLDDIVFRRTELGTAGHPGREALRVCAETAGQDLGWSADTIESEIHRVENRFSLVSGGCL